MPAIVPPGYTRGPIVFIGPLHDHASEERLLQLFWDNAGAYGARILVISLDEETDPAAHRFAHLFAQWESDSVAVATINSRGEAQDGQLLGVVEAATGLLILGENPVRSATILGGTPLAQAMRRANAQGKTIGGVGSGGAILCEHMISFDPRQDFTKHPYLHRQLIQFAPGLGITNRVAVDSIPSDQAGTWMQLARLLNAVAYNPFLIGIGLKTDAGVVIYPDNSLEVFGQNNVLVVDGAGMTYTNVHEAAADAPLSMLGIQLHMLTEGYTFDLAQRSAHPPSTDDIPEATQTKSAF